MLQLQNSYSLQDEKRLFGRGCATDHGVAFSTDDGAIHVLSQDAKLLYTLSHGKAWASALEITCINSDPHNEVLIVGHENSIKMCTLATGASREDFPNNHKALVTLLRAFQIPADETHKDGWTMVVSTDLAGTIMLWEMSTGMPKLLHTLEGHNESITNLAFHPLNQKILISSSYDGSIRVWDVQSGTETLSCILEDRDAKARSFVDPSGQTRVYKESVSSMVVTPDGKIISGGTGGLVRVWDSRTGTLEKSWQAHFDGHPKVGPVLNKILLHPSRESFITTGTDGRIRQWDLSTYECLREIKPFEHSTLPGTIAWRGHQLLCAGKDGSPENTCGDFNRVIAWDLAQSLGEDEAADKFNELVPPCNAVHQLWPIDSRVVISARRKGVCVIEIWSEEQEAV